MAKKMNTGRFYVKSIRTGKVYCVEPFIAHTPEWGSVDPSTGEFMHKKGWLKYSGGIKEKDSIITEENGFKNIRDLEPGVSPLDEIEKIDAKYPTIGENR